MASYRHEARKCTRGKAYLAATVMQVAALEAGLQAMCFIYPEEMKKSSVYAKKGFRGKRNKALEFSLYELITIVEELRWFPPNRTTWAGKRATVGGFSHQIRNVRNFVHPGVRAGERSDPLKFTKGLYGVVYEIAEVANFLAPASRREEPPQSHEKRGEEKDVITVATSAPLNPSLFSSITPAKSRPQSRTRLAGILSA